eukprot:TRINITY_DN21928_c0_g1_i1.p1 TRINITY_DN21928_c0_g1~~TRINITY_DN21928_c0_g1_i1.p1  ORF type:complete len:317 (+),score=161.84 TRINITY_DN21928_c0_g1_i1:91-1041(+)
MADWCTIESDPAVFTEMMEKFGVKGAEVVEVESMDCMAELNPCYGLIFLFKWKPDKRQVEVVETPNVYFAKQVVSNACATQAIINILLNCQDQVEVGPHLKEFYNFTKDLTPEPRGECMGSQDVLRKVHNSFARPQCFSFDKDDGGDDDAYHFIAYMPKDGMLYELDGLQAGPILLGDAGQDWLESARPKVQERIAQVQAADTKGNGLMFTLLALTHDRIARLEAEVAAEQMSDAAAVKQARLVQLREQRDAGRRENCRRRHNYIPLAMALLKALAEKEKLQPMLAPALERAQQKHKEKQEKKKKEKEAAKEKKEG